MTKRLTENYQQRACEAIENTDYDFTAKFHAAFDLYHIARQQSQSIQPRTIKALKNLLLSTTFDRQRQRRFLFREAAGVLTTIVQLGGREQPMARAAYDALRQVLYHGRDHAHQAAAESLGSLALDINEPRMAKVGAKTPPLIAWKRLPAAFGLPELLFGLPELFRVQLKGRSLTATLSGDRIMVIKLAREPGDAVSLVREVQWMTHLSSLPVPGGIRFDVPQVLTTGGGRPLFRLKGLPPDLKPPVVSETEPAAIGYIASRAYFNYPNDGNSQKLPTPEAFVEMMGRNAYLFGWLAGQGIVHEAPIPLFHNRIQQGRRRDGGVYEWFRAGRLDRWLASCAYPNFGRSGLRDFEHFGTCGGQGIKLYRHMGNQLLSLLLVAGSYFRAKDPCRIGWDRSGRPVDARDLFDMELLCRVLEQICRQYHIGFVGEDAKALAPFDVHHLAHRMIDEMGVDRHMQEFLRIVDQQQMDQETFQAFLADRGYPPEAIGAEKKGTQDLALDTGPHLGAFNRSISIPELIEGAAAMAASCVAERFLNTTCAPAEAISVR